MGQRSQIILLKKQEEDKKEKNIVLSVWHNQWHYGGSFLSMLSSVLDTWEKGIKKLKKENSFYDWQIEQLIENTIRYCDLKDFPYYRKYSKILEYGAFKEVKTIEEVFESCDNNNGYIILLLDGDKLSYDIITGYEDAKENISVSAKEYLELFYKTELEVKNAGFTPKEMNEILKTIDKSGQFDSQEIILNKEILMVEK